MFTQFHYAIGSIYSLSWGWENPTFNDGNHYIGYINPYGDLGLMTIPFSILSGNNGSLV